MWFSIVLSIHLLLCVSLISLVLLQQGKGADAGVAFGGGSNSLFGAGGANSLMVKITTTTAILFMVTSIFLIRGYSELMDSAGTSSSVVVEDSALKEAAPAAVAPVTQDAPIVPAPSVPAPEERAQ
jgi:preprotein translocase subunit SecG